MLLGFGRDGGDERAVARGERAREQAPPTLLLAQYLIAQQRGQVEFQILGVIGERLPDGFDTHRLSSFQKEIASRGGSRSLPLHPKSGRSQGFFTFLPIAGAELVGLERVKHA